MPGKMAAVVLALGVLLGGAGWTGYKTPALFSRDAQRSAARLAQAPANDPFGDPLPKGALARLGTVRLRAPAAQLAVTADGTEVVCVDPNHTVRRFDAHTGALRAVSQIRPKYKVHLARLSPHGRYVLLSSYASNANQLELWDVRNGNRLGMLAMGEYHIKDPNSTAFSQDEHRVAIADSTPDGLNHRVRIWDLTTWQTRVLWSRQERITQVMFDPVVIFSPDGRRLAGIHLDRVLRCWDTDSGKLLWNTHKDVYSGLLAFSADSQQIRTNAFRSWDATTGNLIEGKARPPQGTDNLIGASPDGRFWVFEDGFDGLVLWKTGEAQAALRLPPLRLRSDGIRHGFAQLPTNFAFTPDGKALIRRMGALQRWELDTGKPVYPDTEDWGHTEEITSLRFSPDGQLLASLAQDHTLHLWSVASGRSKIALDAGLSACLAFAHDGKHVFAVPASMGNVGLRQWDAATGAVRRDFKVPDANSSFMQSSGNKELRVTADGRKILMLTWKNGRSGDESVLSTWDIETGACLVHQRVPWTEDSIITPDGASVLAFESREHRVNLLDIKTGKPRLQFAMDRAKDSPSPHRCNLALSPSGRLMAAQVAFIDRSRRDWQYDEVRIGAVSTGRQIAKISVPDDAVFVFSADDRLFAIATGDDVLIWETASWQQVGALKKAVAVPGGRITSITITPDARKIATGHADSTVLLWDATLGLSAKGSLAALADAENCWTELAGADASHAYAALWRLVDDPQRALAFLNDRLKPVLAAAPEMTQPLIDSLDSSQFPKREAAKKKLAALGEAAEPALRSALKANPSLETRKRLEALLGALDTSGPLRGEMLRGVRAVQILERIATPEAVRFLERLNQGLESASLTSAAKDALAR